MKYAVVYTGCRIVEADSEYEARERFHEENFLIEAEEFAYVNPCFGDADALNDICYDECWEATGRLTCTRIIKKN